MIFDPDIIELPKNRFFKLSSRSLTRTCPYKESDQGVISPRMFKNIPDRIDLSGGPFKDFVEHNFPDRREKAKLLITFYHCLLAKQLPMKTPKLTLIGDRNSGKTSLVNVLFGLTHPEFVATLSKEKVFGTSMIDDDTMLLFIDELCPSILPQDQAKILLQGGPITIPRKHKDPIIVNNTAGKFINTGL